MKKDEEKPLPKDQRKIPVDELRLGMYVIMPVSWKDHPFFVNRFQLSSEEEIRKMKEAGLTEVLVDFKKSRLVEAPKEEGAKPPEPLQEKGPKEVVPDELREALADGSRSPEEKAQEVYNRSSEMIERLLAQPTARNIKATKQAISGIVEMILADKETSHYLTRITKHDHYTYTHSVNVGFLAVCLAKVALNGSERHDMHELGAGFFLHDVGKVGVDQGIINKPGKLTPEEMQEMRRHPSLGFKLLAEAKQLTEESKIIVLQHHERYDGKGYPKGLRGQEIHLYGRICSLADVYDALTSDRPYRRRMSPFEALKVMKEEMIDHFQKDLFEKFVLMLS